MEIKEIDITSGSFGVLVGKMWASEDYSATELKEKPERLMGFAKADALARKTGGIVKYFKPVDLGADELDLLRASLEREE